MKAVLWSITVGALRMQLWERPGGYYVVLNLLGHPEEVSIVYLGSDRHRAIEIFARKVECHRTMVGS
jgi:hypothetical protein